MRHISLHAWKRNLLALLGLFAVLSAWSIARFAEVLAEPIAKLAEILADRLREPVTKSVLVFLLILIVALVVLHSALEPGAAIAVAFVLASASRWLFAFPPASNENSLTLHQYPRTTWRLCDPELSTHGLWRAEVNAGLPTIGDFDDCRILLPLVQELVGDWSFRSGWPYYQRRVLSITRASQRTAGPFSSMADSSGVYRVRLDIGETAWIHFGDGYVELQLEPPHRTRSTRQAPEFHDMKTTSWSPVHDADRAEAARELEPVMPGPHPLWDRWIDP